MMIIISAIVVSVVLFYFGQVLYQRSVRLRGQLQMARVFTNISHEILTPLTVISASVERLREQEPRFGKDYALMELNINRMVRLMQLILETSKLQSGNLKLLVSQGDVMQYISQTALCIEPLMFKRNLSFNITCTPKSMMGWIDTDKLDKIIYNLLSNAAKYTPPHGHVSLNVQTNKTYDHVIIKVIDDGIGISSQQQKHIFQRFNDGNYRRTNAIGTGLGLSLTHDLVELHGGTITCQSEEGAGTTFTIMLPINKESFNTSQIDEQHHIDTNTSQSTIIDLKDLMPQADEPEPVSLTSIHNDAYRILIVEDNNDLLMLMRSMLSTKYRIFTAHNGKEAIDVIGREDLHLIVSDVMMPDMDGNELTRILKSTPEWRHLPIILLTAKTQDEDRRQSMLLGADDYIKKPFRLGELELRINNIIENRKRIHHDESGDKDNGNDTPHEQTAEELFLGQTHDCVMNHLADYDFNRNTFAQEMGMSDSTLYNRLRSLTGMSVSAYIRDIRMKEAYKIAQSTPQIRVSDLAYRVGFQDPKYFATCFRKEFGIQPSEFMEKQQSQTGT